MDFVAIEKKWQLFWKEKNLFKVKGNGKKFYVLEMFPYPSGDLHMGHLKNYAIGDVVSRIKFMQGYDVLHPMGWDAFGLPAENAAINYNIHPRDWTNRNINIFRETLKKAGMSYDWEREISTCEPDYYRWTQWIFLLLYKKGLAYRKKEFVHYCEHCKTVLANEQVIDGKCERCKRAVVKKEFEQWFFKITAYAERLLNDLEKLRGNWPDNVIKQQEEWIGKSEGVLIKFKYRDKFLEVFTTRVDTIFGVSFISVAPEHPIVKEIIKHSRNKEEIEKYVNIALSKTEIERRSQTTKTGVFTYEYATHPLTGQEIPIYISDYVIYDYGTGIVMGVPAHDQRDYEFAKKFNLRIIPVIKPKEGNLDEILKERAFEDYGILINSSEFNNLESKDAILEIAKKLESLDLGKRSTSYRLRDWLISRQRYWGCPIPIIYCDNCGIVEVPESELPVLLPERLESWKPIYGYSPLENDLNFVYTNCPKCKSKARRETDTMDTFVDSSWYYLRFIDSKNENEIISKSLEKLYMPVDLYIGGIEHATKHLIYARFIYKVLYDEGIVNYDEPFNKLFTQGLVLKRFYWDPVNYKTVDESVVVEKEGKFYHAESGIELEEKVEMMSKSRGNIVPLSKFLDENGSDVARIAILFAAPPEQDFEWTDSIVQGAKKFLNRVLSLYSSLEFTEDIEDYKLKSFIHGKIKEIRERMDDFRFNTAIAKLMEFLNYLKDYPNKKSYQYKEALKIFSILLAPFAPHIAEEIYHRLGYENSVFENPLPDYDEKYIIQEEIKISVQINGIFRGVISVGVNSDEDEVFEVFKNSQIYEKYIKHKKIVKKIYVKNKVLSLVVA
ncbi:MAG: leucine--tRNA ligase [candidate division WOR-3 bacterium]|nr:leucine--tRNA ligase [candidate division WOR-3 bacterium]MCX7947836.1 leucine--tRNA ligase [candidate division WOR-3 bacterium]MDW8151283.1 leucine--tRNA ligase [candidate division WOR-3 bacterium]